MFHGLCFNRMCELMRSAGFFLECLWAQDASWLCDRATACANGGKVTLSCNHAYGWADVVCHVIMRLLRACAWTPQTIGFRGLWSYVREVYPHLVSWAMGNRWNDTKKAKKNHLTRTLQSLERDKIWFFRLAYASNSFRVAVSLSRLLRSYWSNSPCSGGIFMANRSWLCLNSFLSGVKFGRRGARREGNQSSFIPVRESNKTFISGKTLTYLEHSWVFMHAWLDGGHILRML